MRQQITEKLEKPAGKNIPSFRKLCALQDPALEKKTWADLNIFSFKVFLTQFSILTTLFAYHYVVSKNSKEFKNLKKFKKFKK